MSENYMQRIVQAGTALGFGGPQDPRNRVEAVGFPGSAAGTPSRASPQPAGVGGEMAATDMRVWEQLSRMYGIPRRPVQPGKP